MFSETFLLLKYLYYFSSVCEYKNIQKEYLET